MIYFHVVFAIKMQCYKLSWIWTQSIYEHKKKELYFVLNWIKLCALCIYMHRFNVWQWHETWSAIIVLTKNTMENYSYIYFLFFEILEKMLLTFCYKCNGQFWFDIVTLVRLLSFVLEFQSHTHTNTITHTHKIH